jgi:hypothetical protein
MQRREFVTALGSAAAWPLIARAQQPDRMRRIGVLMGSSETEAGTFFAAFVEELARLGWTDGRNVRIERRWANADAARASVFARELVATQPDVILVSTTPATAALHRENGTIPIVFTLVLRRTSQKTTPESCRTSRRSLQRASPAARRRPETQNSRCAGSRRPSAAGGIGGDPIDRKWSKIPLASSNRSIWA